MGEQDTTPRVAHYTVERFPTGRGYKWHVIRTPYTGTTRVVAVYADEYTAAQVAAVLNLAVTHETH